MNQISTPFKKTKRGTFGRRHVRKLNDVAIDRALNKAGLPNPFPLPKKNGFARLQEMAEKLAK
jgi:hypothetical protein